MEALLRMWLDEQIKITRQDYLDAIEVQSMDAAQWFLAKLRVYEQVKDKVEVYSMKVEK